MIYLKDNPVGIDVDIQRIQQRLYDKLSENLVCDIVAYGRIYKDIEEGVTKPLFYINNGEYKYVLIDDTINGLHFFFVESDSSEINSHSCFSSTSVDIIVLVDDMRVVKPSIDHYADEEIMQEVKSYLSHELELVSSTKGSEALKGFDINGQKFRHPFFVFKLTGNINNY